jgi:hypothetical protein
MKHILFFALKDDLLPILKFVEARNNLQYLHAGQFPDRITQRFLSGTDIPNLGYANVESSVNCSTYLVADRGENINWEAVKRTNGEQWFIVDQLHNPDTVTFTAAGVWKENVVLHGRIATASASVESQRLMKDFNSAVKKNFKKVKAFWVGPSAYKLFEEGKRLTGAEQSPVEYDLRT